MELTRADFEKAAARLRRRPWCDSGAWEHPPSMFPPEERPKTRGQPMDDGQVLNFFARKDRKLLRAAVNAAGRADSIRNERHKHSAARMLHVFAPCSVCGCKRATELRKDGSIVVLCSTFGCIQIITLA